MRPLLLLLSVTALNAACVTPPRTPKDCRSRAEAEYRRCLHPLHRARGEATEPVRSADSQACQKSYQQAIDACGGGGPVAPVPKIGTSTAS